MRDRPGFALWYHIWYHVTRRAWAGLAPRRIVWGQINRYRDTLRPLLYRFPRLSAVVGLWACPKCGQIAPPREAADCDICAFIACRNHAMRGARKWIEARRKAV